MHTVAPALIGIRLLLVASGLSGAATARADVVSLELNPSTVFGTQPSTGTVTLDAAFGRERTVDLFSSNPNVAAVPPTVIVANGRNSATFTVSTSPVAVQTDVTITATHEGVSRQAVLTVRPPQLVSITFNPNPVVGSLNSTATITINYPAHANWLCSISGPFPPVYFSSGTIVQFQPGATTATKVVNTQAVASPVNALITVRPPTGQSPNISATLTVEPWAAESISLSPPAVEAGEPTLGCVTLNAPAPAGGAVVSLMSSNPDSASVPPSVDIPAGDFDGCFLVQTGADVECETVTISASYGGRTVDGLLEIGDAQRRTDNALEDRWNARHSTVRHGRVLWTDGDDVLIDDGAGPQIVQARGALEAVTDSFFALGSAASPAGVIAAWRRGTDFAWVWSIGGAPILVSAVNPIDPEQPLNPEAVAIDDGAVFMALQAFSGGQPVRHVFRVDPATGVATILTGSLAVPGADRISTSGGRAAWVFDDATGLTKLHYYDGSSVREADAGEFTSVPRLVGGRLVYSKLDGGVSHVFLYDATLGNPSPVRISADTDTGHGHFAPATDGWHVAWLHGLADRTQLDVTLLGDLQPGGAAGRTLIPLGVEFPLQVQRGQIVWKDAAGGLRYYAAGRVRTPCLTPSANASAPWLADGQIAWYGRAAGTGETDNEVYVYEGLVPDDGDTPLPPLLVTATGGDARATLEFDRVLGGTSYNVYLAEQPGVTKANYASLPGGRRVTGFAASPAIVTGLSNGRLYYFVVTAVTGGDEGGSSMEAFARPDAPWTPVSDLAAEPFYAAATSDVDSGTAFAASATQVFRTTDGGETWAVLTGGIANRRTRALAVRGNYVFAATIDGEILRSVDGGATWTTIASSEALGESNASIVVDRSMPQRLYSGDFRLSPDAPSVIVRTIDSGATWTPSPTEPELRAYAIAVDPAGIVYAGGTGMPALARSVDGGETWIDVSPGPFAIYSLAIDPADPAVLLTGTRDDGLFRSVNGGTTWSPAGSGLPVGDFEPVSSIVIDPLETQLVRAGTARGVFVSVDGGGNWIPNSEGLGANRWVHALARFRSGRLLAATDNGVYLLNSVGCPADLDLDGSVGIQDLAILLGHYGTPDGAGTAEGDLNGDGAVGLADLALLLASFGLGCP